MSVKEEFIIKRDGKNFVLYAGLLDLAHGQGLKNISTTIIQIPTKDNEMVAICQAEVETDKGHFSGVGDASPQNVSRPMLTCLLRMAETRAKARALRDATNVGVAAFEELGEELIEDNSSNRFSGSDNQTARALPPPAKANNSSKPASVKQLEAIKAIATRKGMTLDGLNKLTGERFGVELTKLTSSQASQMFQVLQ